MLEELLALVFGRIIVGFFGRYTLLGFYKLTNNKEGIRQLSNPWDEMEAFGGGCLINIVGVIAFALVLTAIVYLFFS